MSTLAQGAPNLLELEILNAACPVDYLVHHADPLIRRNVGGGQLLCKLTATSFRPHPMYAAQGWPFPQTSSPDAWQIADNTCPRTLLGRNMGCRLTQLELAVRGAGVDYLPSNNSATVAIHPAILVNLRSLRLESVRLYLPPPHLAQPDSHSFLPLAHIPAAARTICPVNHLITLPNLERLTMSSNALNFPSYCVPAHRPSPVLHALPQLPSLVHFSLFIDSVHDQSKLITTAIVGPVLRRLPRLEYARFAYLTPNGSNEKREQAIHDEFFAPYPRELAPCPRLQAVQMNEEEPVEYFKWLGAHEGRLGCNTTQVVQLSPLAIE